MEVEPPAPGPNPSSSQSVATEHTGNRMGENPRDSIVFCVKAEFVANPSVKATVMKLHIDLIRLFHRTHTHSLIVFDKNEKILTKYHLDQVRNLADYKALFDVSSKPGNNTRPTRHSVVMNFRSTLSLRDIKSNFSVQEYLDTNKIYLRFHHFPRDIIETTSLGWLCGYHPTQHDHVALKDLMLERIGANFPDEVIPYFHLTYSSPSRARKGGGPRITTKALEIMVDRDLRFKLDRFIKNTFAGENFYVKWKLRDEAPETFRNAMTVQSKFLAESRTVPIHGITEEQMLSLRPHLLNSPATISIERTRTTPKTGRWNLLSNREHFKQAKSHVQDVLKKFSEFVPTENSALPTDWKAWDEDANTLDNSSEGDASYLTTSARSFASLVNDEDCNAEENKPIVHFDVSYLHAVTNTRPAATTVPQPETDQAEQIRLLKEQVQVLTDQLTKLTSPLVAKPPQVVQTPPDAVTETATTTSEPTPSTLSNDNLIVNRISNIENVLERLITIMDKQGLKPTRSLSPHEEERSNKKPDVKVTPSKQSPSLGEATASQVP